MKTKETMKALQSELQKQMDGHYCHFTSNNCAILNFSIAKLKNKQRAFKTKQANGEI